MCVEKVNRVQNKTEPDRNESKETMCVFVMRTIVVTIIIKLISFLEQM